MLITQGNLSPNILKGEVAIVTGAGRGIGYEAARALIWLGANVAIAEVNEDNGKTVAQILEKEFGTGKAIFIKTDIGNDKDIEKLAKEVLKKWGKVDIILNNATVFSMGPVKDTQIEKWDLSYRVNLRGPVILAQTFLPDMIKRKHGVIVCVSSSGAAPFMGAYEVFKTAQGELASTIAAEVEDTGVYAFTIGPGIVKTPGFIEGGGQVAAYMGKTLDQLLEMNKNFEITPEAAGVGFAAAIAQAQKYHGQETSSIQALKAIGIDLGLEEETKQPEAKTQTVDKKQLLELFQPVIKTYNEQLEGWKSRNLFQKQWVFRDFKKETNMSVDEMQTALTTLGDNIETGAPTTRFRDTLNKLHDYYTHQQQLLKGYEKIQKKLAENQALIEGWKCDIKALLDAL
jgi:NAD(P)-dependent dehydrogenase (short-subunit alcohol dehydrogenase family)/flagellar biosynthesis chaperone FliJ